MILELEKGELLQNWTMLVDKLKPLFPHFEFVHSPPDDLSVVM